MQFLRLINRHLVHKINMEKSVSTISNLELEMENIQAKVNLPESNPKNPLIISDGDSPAEKPKLLEDTNETNQNTSEKRKVDEEYSQNSKKPRIETKLLKNKRPGFSEDRYDETSYYFENGLRKVYPYYFTFTTFTKGRWVGEKILDVFSREFRAHAPKEYERSILAGTLTVNYEKVPTDYKLKHNDLLVNVVHRHEVPVTNQSIKIVHIDEDILVVDKPASIPVHPCGRYRHNTVVFILAKEHDMKNLRTIHRLDRLTSGLLLFGRSSKKTRQLEHQIRTRIVEKEYVCRVDGKFPDEIIECNEPIEVISYKIGVCKVSAKGKECETTFQRLGFNGKTSVVLCKPKTGRMHQIRVHLQYLGFPIVNDPLYNHEVFGPLKGKGGDLGGKTEVDLVQDLINIHNAENWLGMDGSLLNPVQEESLVTSVAANVEETFEINKKQTEELSSCYDPKKTTVDSHCYECKVRFRDPKPHDLVMYLHAWKYSGPGWEFQTDLPDWAKVEWVASLNSE